MNFHYVNTSIKQDTVKKQSVTSIPADPHNPVPFLTLPPPPTFPPSPPKLIILLTSNTAN